MATIANVLLVPAAAAVVWRYAPEMPHRTLSVLAAASMGSIALVLLVRRLVGSTTRPLWLGAAALAIILVWAFGPDHAGLWAIGFGAPVVIAALYARLTYEEVYMLYTVGMLREAVKKADRLLFEK